MKPSNTGIRWFLYDDFRNACLDLDNGRGSYEKIAEAAAQIAIAEYRKEAKAEWQRGLAAKVDEAAFVNTRKVFKNGELSNEERRVVLLDDVLALLNENDHAE